MVTLRVRRWSAEAGERWQAYGIEAGPDTTVLDALVAAQREQDPTLAFRYACRVGMCGTCALVVDGRERWACRTRLAALGPGPVTVRPLYHLPVLRDLVVDLAPFAGRMVRAHAVFTPAAGAEPYALVPGDSAERRQIDAGIECIGCAMCLSACTVVARDERFPGPAALNRVFTLERDRRDGGGARRLSVLLSDDGLARCRGQANCVEVCPMGLAPAESIARLRRMAVRRLVGLGRWSRGARGVAAVALLLACAVAVGPAGAQTRPPAPRGKVVPWIEIPAEARPAWAPWALADAEARLTIVAGLPTPERYRVCNESNTPAVVSTDAEPDGVDLPPRSCVDLGARTITLRQPRAGIPARGSFVRLD